RPIPLPPRSRSPRRSRSIRRLVAPGMDSLARARHSPDRSAIEKIKKSYGSPAYGDKLLQPRPRASVIVPRDSGRARRLSSPRLDISVGVPSMNDGRDHSSAAGRVLASRIGHTVAIVVILSFGVASRHDIRAQAQPTAQSQQRPTGLPPSVQTQTSPSGLQIPVQPPAAPPPAILNSYQKVTDDRLRHPSDADWLMVRRSYDGWGYSPLAEITAANVKRLQPVWMVSTGMNNGHQAPPIVNNGVMFVATSYNQVIALNAKSGEELWRYRSPSPPDARVSKPVNRGVALY